MPGLYVIQIQIQAVWPVSQKKLQESKAEEETRYVKESHGIVLFFTNFRSKRAATGKLLESTTMSAVWKGFVLSSWTNSNDVQNIFHFVNSVPKVIFCMNWCERMNT